MERMATEELPAPLPSCFVTKSAHLATIYILESTQPNNIEWTTGEGYFSVYVAAGGIQFCRIYGYDFTCDTIEKSISADPKFRRSAGEVLAVYSLMQLRLLAPACNGRSIFRRTSKILRLLAARWQAGGMQHHSGRHVKSLGRTAFEWTDSTNLSAAQAKHRCQIKLFVAAIDHSGSYPCL